MTTSAVTKKRSTTTKKEVACDMSQLLYKHEDQKHTVEFPDDVKGKLDTHAKTSLSILVGSCVYYHLNSMRMRKSSYAGTQHSIRTLIDEQVEWDWVNSNGKFIKRLRKALRKADYYISDHELAHVGERFKRMMIPNEPMSVDFTSIIDWRDGEFGDKGSCYWGDNEGAINVIQDNGGFAFRAYDEDGCGKGRCWIAPNYPVHGTLVAFNFYGFSHELGIHALRLRLSETTGEEIVNRGVHLYNNGSSTGLLHINEGSEQVFGTEEMCKSLEGITVDLQWSTNYY